METSKIDPSVKLTLLILRQEHGRKVEDYIKVHKPSSPVRKILKREVLKGTDAELGICLAELDSMDSLTAKDVTTSSRRLRNYSAIMNLKMRISKIVLKHGKAVLTQTSI